jgi:nucleoside-diphosphate-sugar epimerase
MRAIVTGGGGFLGMRLAEALLADTRVERVILSDVADFGPVSGGGRVEIRKGNLTDAAGTAALAAEADVIFHLAAVVSGQAEADFDLGMRVNLDGTRGLLEAARAAGRRPVFVFASSLAVFGPPIPDRVTDDTPVRPQSSYGTQKALGELLVSDFSRKGFVDGRVLRLPTVCVRPGRPNAAASSFVSGIIREPLRGERAVCPVDRSLELWLTSPGAAVRNLARAAMLPAESLGSNRIVNLPGITVSVDQMLAALERVGGPRLASLVSFAHDPAVDRIVSSWPSRFDVARAVSLGFERDDAFDSLVRQHVDERAASAIRPS